MLDIFILHGCSMYFIKLHKFYQLSFLSKGCLHPSENITHRPPIIIEEHYCSINPFINDIC